jgi:hypothetical protein
VIVLIIAIMIGIVIVGLHALAMSAPFRPANTTMIMTAEMDVGAGTSDRSESSERRGSVVARGVSDVAYEAGPILQTWAQLEMIKHGGLGGRYYGGGS